MKIIVGLGNPGEQYSNSRHNIGWLALDWIFGPDKYQENRRFNALVKESSDILLVKPLTYMNNSGLSVRKIMDYYKLLPKSAFGLKSKPDADLKDVLIVLQDDLDIPLGEIKKSSDSGSAGHRGIESLIAHLKTKKFTRYRIGIKTELLKTHIPPEKFVLDRFPGAEKEILRATIEKIANDIKSS